MNQDNQIILACDDNGNFDNEYIPKEVGHTGDGRRHLAIAVLLYNDTGEVLLQRRRHKVFDDIWDLTGATHPLHLEKHDETFEEATERCLEREYGIPRGTVPLENLGTFNYFAEYKDGFCENEHCALLIGRYNSDLKLNTEVGYGHKWIGKDEFLVDIQSNPTMYSPWAVAGLPLLKEHNFFD